MEEWGRVVRPGEWVVMTVGVVVAVLVAAFGLAKTVEAKNLAALAVTA